MEEFWDGLVKAVHLIVSLDPTVVDITRRSLAISATSCAIATLICLPLGSLIHFRHFRGKRLLISTVQTLFSMPTVAVGLVVYVMFSASGPLGGLGIYLTPKAMVVGQVMLIAPVMLGLIIAALSGVDKAVPETAVSLGADRLQMTLLSFREARYAITAAVIMGFARAISEVGLSMMVGGNISGYTRTITTAMMLETQRGEMEMALALGMILIAIALVVNIVLNRLQQK